MKNRWILLGSILGVLILALAAGLSRAQGPGPQGGGDYAGTPVGTAFTYQGLLKKNGVPVNGTCDFWFTLYDAETGGTPLGYNSMSLTVVNGLFTAGLDFGPSFQGARWLEIAVRCPGDTGYISLSPRQRLTPAPYALALPGLFTLENITSTNIIGGYSGNGLAPGVVGATISGGGSSETTCGAGICINRVSDNYGTVGGGKGNQVGNNDSNTANAAYATVGGGYSNTASGSAATIGGGAINTASDSYAIVGGGRGNTASNWYATVGGGSFNTASGLDATVSGGWQNTASGYVATVGGGYTNTASSDYATVGGGYSNIASGYAATIPGGSGAVASHYGEMAYASGAFANRGDAQTSIYVLRNTSSGTDWVELFLDGSGRRLTIAPGRTVVFDALVVGRTADGESAGCYVRSVIENVGGTVAFVGTPSVTYLGKDDSAWEVQVVASNYYDALLINVKGNGETIRWVAVVRTVEVSW